MVGFLWQGSESSLCWVLIAESLIVAAIVVHSIPWKRKRIKSRDSSEISEETTVGQDRSISLSTTNDDKNSPDKPKQCAVTESETCKSPLDGTCLPSEAVIDIQNLSFSYYHHKALHGISFKVRRGKLIGLLGPNGAGKSTTLKILAGILSTESGKVRIADYALPEQQLEAKKIIGYLPESPLLYECLSGMDFLEFMGRIQGLEEKVLQPRIRVLLETFELNNVRIPRISGYSKGMRQKILLAAALLHDPDVFLLDEPLSGLDVDTCILIKDLLTALCGQGKTVLYSSHVLDVVEKVCNRVIVIDHGRIMADAPLEELRAQSSDESLEEIFRKLTHSEDTAPKIARILEVLHS